MSVRGQWRDGEPNPMELFRATEAADEVEAHNAFFEFAMWLNVCVNRMGWPRVPNHKWRCSAARAAAAGLPRNLEDAGMVAGCDVVKDMEGRKAMLKLARPRKPTKHDKRKWHDDEDTWQKMLAYNRDDVASEMSLSDKTPPLSDRELKVYQCSERMNRRGFRIDRLGCEMAVKIATEHADVLIARFRELTGVDRPTMRDKFKAWIRGHGVEIENTQADTLDAMLERGGLDPEVAEAIGIVRQIGRSSVGKYQKLLNYADADDRVRGCFLYHGAHTGRWAGSGPQPQNFKRDCPWDMDEAWRAIRVGSLGLIECWYGDPLTFLSEVTRGAICAAPGRRFMSGDFAQIEPRVLFWQAGERRGLDVFARDEDIYLDMASIIYNRKVVRSKEDDYKRYVGKHAILSLGFGSGYVKFLLHLRDLGAPPFTRKQICDAVPPEKRRSLLAWILHVDWKNVRSRIPGATQRDAEELVLTKYIVDKYRLRYKNTVVKLWYDMEDAFRDALKNPGKMYRAGKVAYALQGRVMKCRLPSGRVMRYWDPEEDESGGLSHAVWSEGQWKRVHTYGGKLVENATQAISRDIMAEAMLRLERVEAYRDIVMTVHDDCIDEVRDEDGDLEEFLAGMAANPEWALDLPIKVDGWIGERYHK